MNIQKDKPDGCAETVATPGMRFGYHKCTKPVAVRRNGNNWCRIHDPIAVEARSKAASERYRKILDAEIRPIRLARLVPRLVSELKEILEYAVVEKAPLRKQELDSIRKLLSEVEKEGVSP